MWDEQPDGVVKYLVAIPNVEKCLARLGGIQKSLMDKYSNLNKLKTKLIAEYKDFLEEGRGRGLFWRQRSTEKWLTKEERDTIYFHSSVVAKRARGRLYAEN